MTEATATIHFVNPDVKEGLGYIEYAWKDWKLGIIADRYDDDGYSDLIFSYGKDERIIHMTRANLLATTTMSSIAKKLEQSIDMLPWADILTYVTGKTVQIARRGQPALPVGTKPETMKQEYRLWPIVQEDEPTTIYCPGGVGKSYLAVYCACLVQFDYQGLSDSKQSWVAIPGNVLYLDWESCHRDHLRRTWAVKKGLGIETEDTFLYRPCDQPLVKDLPNIQRLVAAHDIKFLIVDSQMAASSYGPDQAQVASQFYNALRSLHCSTLTLDHVSKEEMRTAADSEGTGPYGSVVKYNRSRQQFELKKHQSPGQDFIELDLIHRKFNEGKLLDHIGIHIDFISDANGHLDRVTFTSCDISKHPVFSATRPLPQRLDDALAAGPLTTKELHEMMPDKTEDTIRATLGRYNKDRYVHLEDGTWVLRAYES
jgi:hypothetical protein